MSYMTENTSYQFIDTNILIYAYDEDGGEKQEKAKELLRELWYNDTGCLSIQVFQEFFVTVTQKIAQPLSISEATDVILDYGQWRVHSPTVDDIQKAIRLQTRYQISFWDAMILNSAISLGCEVLWSEDLNVGQIYDGMLLSNPFVTA